MSSLCDFSELKQLYPTTESYLHILQLCLKEIQNDRDAIAQAMQTASHKSAKFSVHRLKGSLYYLLAENLIKQLEEMEILLDTDSLPTETINTLYQNIDSAITKILLCLEEECQNTHALLHKP